MIARSDIMTALTRALAPLDSAIAMWEGGSASFGRLDDLSDIDLAVVSADGQEGSIFEAVDAALAEIAPIAIRFEIPQPSWHGHQQVFYLLEGTSPYLLIDLSVIGVSSPNKFLEREIHGDPVVLFDKQEITQDQYIDPREVHAAIERRIEMLKVRTELFHPFVEKELRRGNPIDAFSFYYGITLAPLVEVLRMRYDPARYNFAARYLYHDLPADVAKRLESLYFVCDADDLRRKHEEGVRWFREEIAQIDLEETGRRLHGETTEG